ncbi:MAG: YceI family protein [Saprospiraceae bacterium]|nr:YceI family protein [Saprospiraceae bacterium]
MTKLMKVSFSILISISIIFSTFAINNAINWQIKQGYSIKFAGTSVVGVFEKINGDIAFDANNLSTSKMTINVEVASIATGNWLMNRHAKGENWFDADKFPKINFTSSNFSKSVSGFIVNGILEMHGVKKDIAIPFTFQNNAFNGNFSVNRTDYGVGDLNGMSKRVSNEIKIVISVPVVKK